MARKWKKGRIRTIIVVLVVALGAFGAYKMGYFGNNNSNQTAGNDGATTPAPVDNDNPTLRVAICPWPIFAGGMVYNEGLLPNNNSRYLKNHDMNVEFVVTEDYGGAQSALVSGDIHALWYTADALPTKAPELHSNGIKVYAQTDWSRGGDICIAYDDAGIKTINDFKGKTIAVARFSPSQSMLLQNLKSAGLTTKDIEMFEVSDPIKAAEAFTNEIVDIAYVWSPFEINCLAHAEEIGRSASIITSTEIMANSIPAVFLAKESVVDERIDEFVALFEGWLTANAEINSDPNQFEKAAKINIDVMGYDTDQEAMEAMNLGRFVTAGDNANFFGFNRSYRGVTGEQIYNEMFELYKPLLDEDVIPAWSQMVDTRVIKQVVNNLSGPMHVAEGSIINEAPSPQLAENSTPVSSKSVSIYFNTNSADLDPNAKLLLNNEFKLEATTNTGAYIKIVGNTDNTGSANFNKRLSEQRAQAVADYMMQQWGVEKNRIIVIGKGPDKAIQDGVSGANDQYRRTDFEIVADQ